MTDLPSDFFIFVDQTSMMTRNNFQLHKGFTSRFAQLLQTTEGRNAIDSGEIDPMPFKQNPDQYPDLSPFVLRLATEQWIEWEAERLRRSVAPHAPSRLSGIYAFGDEATCRAVSAKYGWDLSTVWRFHVNTGLAWRAARVNMEVVSLMRTIYRLASWDTDSSNYIWSHYWSGGEDLQLDIPAVTGPLGNRRDTVNSGVIWEWLIEGQVVCPDDRPAFSTP
jgi:hypothetical protein